VAVTARQPAVHPGRARRDLRRRPPSFANCALGLIGSGALAVLAHRMDVYLCGPPGMIDAARTALAGSGVPPRRIHYESFEF
jgi:ferredoxin-NADP reductase